ncbi:hypothetical protein TraAM80_08084 [Trypanosoma rangeli]|uniref:Uncharacterized protein n=1 Tax=Trypanosoma rangeli TaxID=5698 RepID=A0A3R7MBP6_TRYRA|nr:uncharacterized protein TraAM80_08084 [Trypanosoma rangeli]RNE99654.1 hypothetical protein TraAM80_08084 [Trypanosoma rangeli]|eukprot:RNE99654.1 hypothetical protein TraAM80_08084 [Trypanosoma rangeli]
MPDSETAPSPRVRVHDAALYADLMDAADWSCMIEREQQRQRLAARRQHETEEWQLQEQMRWEEMRLKSARDTAAAAARLQRQARENTQEQEHAEFMCRLNAFVQDRKELIALCAWQEFRDATHAQRVVEGRQRAWEKEVMRPVQEFIDAQIEDVRGERRRARLRQQMLTAFLQECNRTDRLGGSHAVYRDLVDEMRYDPLQQLQACVIRYPAPRPRKTDIDAWRREARGVQKKYAQLALNYRALTRESTTGILSDPPQEASLPAAGKLPTLSGAQDALLASWDKSAQVMQGARSSESDPALFKRRLTGNHSNTTTTRMAQTTVMPPLHRLPSPQDRRHLQYGIDVNVPDALAEWMQQRRAPRPRDNDLPVTDWARFSETLLGRMATADGDLKPSVQRRIDTARRAQHSDVMFDHYNFPRGLEGPLHTGKRVV